MKFVLRLSKFSAKLFFIRFSVANLLLHSRSIKSLYFRCVFNIDFDYREFLLLNNIKN